MAVASEVGPGLPGSDVDDWQELSRCFVVSCGRSPVVVASGPGYSIDQGPGVLLATACEVHQADAVAAWDHRADVELMPMTTDSQRDAMAAALLTALGSLLVWWLRR